MSQIPDDPFAPSDATVMRPRPGRRSNAGREPEFPSQPPPSSPFQPAPRTPQPVLSAASGHTDIGLIDFSAKGSNALLQAAVPLLVLAGRLRGQIANADVEKLRSQAVQEIRAFEERARQANVPSEDVLAARYAICTVIDEAVLNTPWGAQSGWAGQSLLVTFHRESSGGEKFFQILDRVMSEAPRYLALLEVLHVCLALGFEGRYRLDERGPARLAEVRQNLYRIIQNLRVGAETDLSPHWKGVEDRRNAVVRLVPLWVIGAAGGAILIGAFILFSAWLSGRSSEVNTTLANVGLEPLFAVAPSAAAGVPVSFKTLLAQQISRGALSVDEEADGRTLITIKAQDLFASASATLNPSYVELMREIGAAAEQVPGRIIVTGHTDDQPVRSFKFQDNFELARIRAQQVAELIKSRLRDPARVEFTGKGSTEPRYWPASTPENRAKNRRVEIVHRRTG
jgi:type VI secretion system protein ImpK